MKRVRILPLVVAAGLMVSVPSSSEFKPLRRIDQVQRSCKATLVLHPTEFSIGNGPETFRPALLDVVPRSYGFHGRGRGGRTSTCPAAHPEPCRKRCLASHDCHAWAYYIWENEPVCRSFNQFLLTHSPKNAYDKESRSGFK
jgi:hypothetical protein